MTQASQETNTGERKKKTKPQRSSDGGYHAIRGFAYQFDHSILTALSKPRTKVHIEFLEDESYEDHCIQIKNREFTTYSPSTVRKPVSQLLNLSIEHPKRKFILHCHFKDRDAEVICIDNSGLDIILGDSKDEFSDSQKSHFCRNFKIHFANNYEAQFEEVVKQITEKFSCDSESLAIEIHAKLQSILIKVAQKKDPSERHITFDDLKKEVAATTNVIFYSSYRRFLGNEKFLRFLKAKYFTFQKSSIPNYKRLFVIDCSEGIDPVEVVDFIASIHHKYYRPDKSESPFICLRNYPSLNEVKEILWDAEIQFDDGTNFNGDRFRIDQLVDSTKRGQKSKVKIVEEVHLTDLLKRISAHDIFDIFTSCESSLKHVSRNSRLTHISLDSVADIKRLL